MTDRHPPLSFEEFVETLAPLGATGSAVPPEREELIREAAEALRTLKSVDRGDSLAELVAANPEWAPVLGLAVELSQEQLRSQLRFRAGTASYRRLAREDAGKLIEILDGDELNLVDRIRGGEKRRTRLLMFSSPELVVDPEPAGRSRWAVS